MLILLIILLVLFGGGGLWAHGNPNYGPNYGYGFGGVGAVLLIILVCYMLGLIRF